MKKQYFVVLIYLLSFSTFSQVLFEEGYYIDNNNKKTNCLIKNLDWKDNPTNFEFKLTENGASKPASIEDVKEFGILNSSKYVRATVNIDRSSLKISEMSLNKKVEFKKEKLFLKVLVEGKANLYFYEKGSLSRFFYNKSESNIEQLVYKKYKSKDGKIGDNNRYRNQLWNDLKCSELDYQSVKSLKYYKKEMISFFVDYNKCTNEDFVSYHNDSKKDLFNLTFRPGINSSSLLVNRGYDVDFDNELAFRFGIEAEFIFSFNRNKWALIIEPTYQNYKSEAEVATTTKKDQVDYTSIEVPVGLRHYFFINNNSKIFVNGSFIFDYSSDSSIINFVYGSDFEIKTRTVSNLAFGLGYKYNDKLSLEFRYLSNRNLMSDYTGSDRNSKYKTISLILGYSIF